MLPKSKKTLNASLYCLVFVVCLACTANADQEDNDDEEDDLMYEYRMKQDRHTCGSGQTGQYPFCKDQAIHHNVYTGDECGEAELEEVMVEMQLMIQDREELIEEIFQLTKITEKNVEREKEDTVLFLADMARFVENTYLEAIEEINVKHQEATQLAVKQIQKLREEISTIHERRTTLKQLSDTKDHLKVLQMFPSLCSPPATIDWSGISVHSDPSVGATGRGVEKLREALNSEENRVSSAELVRIKSCAVDVTFDPDTAHPNLIISEDRKQVRTGYIQQNVNDNPQRFDQYLIVLGKEGFTSGKFYYEVQVEGKTIWYLGVAIESIDRKGNITLSPEHGYLVLHLREEYFAAGDGTIIRSQSQNLKKVGIYIDYERGQVSFYDVNNRSHIHSFTGYTISEKLYPFFSPGVIIDEENSAPMVITPVEKQLSINVPT
ncbi:E3 ubiquitin-protein ligase TRIM39-like [Esox lucius]|uniref:B30.2/SPRY domain-containing protein n=1 Tax=Esox lucius TaxID=8010 RepID=A0AAY5L9U1_ESOLU|nr:E3 ubiquitin-protein ligase TRIM39-like [Esox lucius]